MTNARDKHNVSKREWWDWLVQAIPQKLRYNMGTAIFRPLTLLLYDSRIFEAFKGHQFTKKTKSAPVAQLDRARLS